MKPFKTITIALVIIVVVCAFCWTLSIALFSYSDRWADKVEDFKSRRTEFQTIASFAKEYISGKGPSEYNWLSYNAKENALYYDGQAVQLNEELQSSLERIEEAFPNPDARLDVIRCYGETVLFCTHNGQYSLVYSPGGRPTFVNTPDPDVDVFVDKITDDWYHVAKNNH